MIKQNLNVKTNYSFYTLVIERKQNTTKRQFIISFNETFIKILNDKILLWYNY